MEIKEGCIYHIDDKYFEIAQDDKLMQNKEKGASRPTFCCMKDKESNLFWMIPMSSQHQKYENISNHQTQKYGRCLGIVLGVFNSEPTVFLLQNMFPVTEKYISHIHTKNGKELPVPYSTKKVISTNIKMIFNLLERNVKGLVYPDVKRLKQIMLDELQQNKKDDMDKTVATGTEKSTKNSTLIMEGLTFDDDKLTNTSNTSKTSDKGLSYIDKLLANAKAGADAYNNRQRETKTPEKKNRSNNLDL